MTINSKRKGKVGELELAKLFTEEGFKSHRSQQFSGKGESAADVIGLPHIHVECKRNEHLNIYDAIEQAKTDSKGENIPTVFHRKNNKKWLVTMEIEEWFELYRAYLGGE